MSNNANLTAMTFTGTATKEVTYGFVMKDDYSSFYCNESESPITDDIELLKYVINFAAENDSVDDVQQSLLGILDTVFKHMNGININGVWYDYDQIKQYGEDKE